MSPSTNMEIERKWLLPKVPAKKPFGAGHTCRVDVYDFEQMYFTGPTDPAEVSMRSEKKRDFATRPRYKLRLKMGELPGRTEVSGDISQEKFEAHREEATAQLTKTRHTFVPSDAAEGPLGNAYLRLEADKYPCGTVVGEIEFSSAERARTYEAPDWFGLEVTGDSRFTNCHIAHHSVPDDPIV